MQPLVEPEQIKFHVRVHQLVRWRRVALLLARRLFGLREVKYIGMQGAGQNHRPGFAANVVHRIPASTTRPNMTFVPAVRFLRSLSVISIFRAECVPASD